MFPVCVDQYQTVPSNPQTGDGLLPGVGNRWFRWYYLNILLLKYVCLNNFK